MPVHPTIFGERSRLEWVKERAGGIYTYANGRCHVCLYLKYSGKSRAIKLIGNYNCYSIILHKIKQ